MAGPSVELLTVIEAAREIRIHPATLRRWIAEGHVPASRYGPRSIRLRRTDVDALACSIPSAASR